MLRRRMNQESLQTLQALADHCGGAFAHIRAEEALQASECFARSLVESLPQNILRKDLAGRFIFANELFCRTAGKPIEQIIGKTDADLYPPELAAKFRRDDAQVIASGRPLQAVEENQSPSGEKTYVEVIKTPLFDANNRPTGSQVIFWDVTARVRPKPDSRPPTGNFWRLPARPAWPK